MTPEQLRNLKDGDIIRDTLSGDAYIVQRNMGLVVIAARTVEVRNASEWQHLYTTVKAEEPVSLVEMITELEILGWAFNNDKNEWCSPDGSLTVRTLKVAWNSRNGFKKPPLAMYAELHLAGWKRISCDEWKDPAGRTFRGVADAWKAMKLRPCV